MNKVVVYTGAFGDNYGFIPQKKVEGIDFVCFTDDNNKVKFPWKPMPLKFEGDNEVLKNRHPKLLPHLYFNQYEVSIYIDSNFLIVGDIHELLKSLGDFKMVTFDHTQTDDSRDCIYEEYNAILEIAERKGVFKDDPVVMEKQIELLKLEGYPKKNGLIKGGVLIRKHNDTKVIKVMEEWWHMVSSMSKRDQLSFNYVAWKNKFKPKIINGDLRRGNPYFYFLSAAQKDYSKKLLKYKLKKFFGIKKHP